MYSFTLLKLNMPIIYRIITSNDHSLHKMWEEWWKLSCISDWKMYFWKEEKKPVKSRALTTESNKSIQYLKMQRENIDIWKEIHYPDFVNDRKQWSDFIHYWTQKNSDEWKLHCEKEKTFEIRWRWATWYKEKKEFTSNKNTIW